MFSEEKESRKKSADDEEAEEEDLNAPSAYAARRNRRGQTPAGGLQLSDEETKRRVRFTGSIDSGNVKVTSAQPGSQEPGKLAGSTATSVASTLRDQPGSQEPGQLAGSMATPAPPTTKQLVNTSDEKSREPEGEVKPEPEEEKRSEEEEETFPVQNTPTVPEDNPAPGSRIVPTAYSRRQARKARIIPDPLDDTETTRDRTIDNSATTNRSRMDNSATTSRDSAATNRSSVAPRSRDSTTIPGATFQPGGATNSMFYRAVRSLRNSMSENGTTNASPPADHCQENLVEAELVQDPAELVQYPATGLSSTELNYGQSFTAHSQSFPPAVSVAAELPIHRRSSTVTVSGRRTKCVVLGLVVIALIIALASVAPKAVGNEYESSDDSESTSSAGKSGAALIVAAVQDCFVEGTVASNGQDGSLLVQNTASLVSAINKLRTQKGCLFDVVIRTTEYHPPEHISFASTHGLAPFAHDLGKGELPITCTNNKQKAACCPTYFVDPDSQDCEEVLCPVKENMTNVSLAHILDSPACSFCQENPDSCSSSSQAMWPDHCIQGEESGIPPSLFTQFDDVLLVKGDEDYVDSYSDFMDNTRNVKTPLDSILKSHDIDTVYLVGLATDYGILQSASDAQMLGYDTNVILDATRSITEDPYEATAGKMKKEGVEVLILEEVLSMGCPS